MNRHERIRLGGSVRRYHTKQVHNFQNVAAHSWGVACILLDIVPVHEQTVGLLRAALYHDLAEYDTGDTPAHAKWASKDLKKALDEFEKRVEDEFKLCVPLSMNETAWLKIADMLELMWYVLEERRMGNRNVDEIFSRGHDYLTELFCVLDPNITSSIRALKRTEYLAACEMLAHITTEYNHACE